MTKKCIYSCLTTGTVERPDDTFVCEYHGDLLRVSMTLATHERVLTTQLLQDLLLGRRSLTAEGTLRQMPPPPLKPQPIAYDDDGTPRYRDPSSPHGLTVRPDRDKLFGDDPRLDKYRIDDEVADDDATV
jgi:hypothetical protein